MWENFWGWKEGTWERGRMGIRHRWNGNGMEVILPAEYHTHTHTHTHTQRHVHTHGREMMGHARKVKINSLHHTHTHTHTRNTCTQSESETIESRVCCRHERHKWCVCRSADVELSAFDTCDNVMSLSLLSLGCRVWKETHRLFIWSIGGLAG